jgi:DNA-binding GntR family transcriptional regulator
LVVRGSEGGFVPATPDVVAMRHLYEARASLELASLRRPFSQGVSHEEAVLLALRQDWTVLADEEPAADPSFVLLDEAFHVTLAEAAGNPALVELLRHVNERIRLARMQDFLDAGRVAQTVDEHLGIVDAVLEGDLVKAEARFVSHLDLSMAVVEQRVMRALARMAGGSDGRR